MEKLSGLHVCRLPIYASEIVYYLGHVHVVVVAELRSRRMVVGYRNIQGISQHASKRRSIVFSSSFTDPIGSSMGMTQDGKTQKTLYASIERC